MQTSGSISRRRFSAEALAAAVTATRLSAAVDAPNILYIILDDLGLRDVGCYGSQSVATPNIDRLAADGLLFEQAYSGCTVCAPARSTIMTGLHTGHTPVRGNSGGISLPEGTTTLGDVLHGAGYTCGGFGKWGIADLNTPGVPERHGFQRFFGYYHQVHAHYFYPDYLIDTGRKVALAGNRGFYDARPAEGPVRLKNPAGGSDRQFSSYLIFDEMKKFLRDNRARKFFCYAPWTPPHARHEIPESDPAWQLYKDKPWSMAAKVNSAYCSMADRFVGETTQLLKELGLESNTLVFFSSDNGVAAQYPELKASSATLRGEKGQMYEGGIRVPMLARWPGHIKAGSRSKLPVYFPDILPTFAEIGRATARLPSKVDGKSFLAELTGNSAPAQDRYMYWEWNGSHFAPTYELKLQACRRGRWKVVRSDIKQPWELYDLNTDPQESRNVAAAHPDMVRDFDAWVRQNRVAPAPQNEPPRPKGAQWG